LESCFENSINVQTEEKKERSKIKARIIKGGERILTKTSRRN